MWLWPPNKLWRGEVGLALIRLNTGHELRGRCFYLSNQTDLVRFIL